MSLARGVVTNLRLATEGVFLPRSKFFSTKSLENVFQRYIWNYSVKYKIHFLCKGVRGGFQVDLAPISGANKSGFF
jgi:hypothetical protein